MVKPILNIKIEEGVYEFYEGICWDSFSLYI